MTCEIIAYSEDYELDNGFYIAVKKSGKELSRKPLSNWNLTKSSSCSLIVRTEKSNFGSLENPIIPELYQIDLVYTVNANANELFLKKEVQEQENGALITKIFLRDVNSGSCQPLPVPNQIYKDEFDISIKKSKGTLISIKDSVKLLKSGDCLGIFDDSLTKKFLF